jgi:hypothetical protein
LIRHKVGFFPAANRSLTVAARFERNCFYARPSHFARHRNDRRAPATIDLLRNARRASTTIDAPSQRAATVRKRLAARKNIHPTPFQFRLPISQEK